MRIRPAPSWWPWRRLRQPVEWPPVALDRPTWATEQTDAHPWATAPTAYQPLIEAADELARPYVVRECGDVRGSWR